MGAVYLQDAVCVLPSRSDLDENMQYIAGTVAEMGGSFHLFAATSILPGSDQTLIDEFRQVADNRLDEIYEKLGVIQASIEKNDDPFALELAEEELKRERVAYLRQQRLAYFGSARQSSVEDRLDSLKNRLYQKYRSDS